MSKLSSLLNPTPNANANADASSDTPASQTQPMGFDGQNDFHGDDAAASQARAQSGDPHHLSTLTSPLEALAAAATSTAPMLSPGNSNGISSTPLGAQQQSFHNPLSRPSSSHTSPPPPFDFARTSDLPAPRFSPGLEQYHHSTGSEARARRMSEITDDASTVLAPLRGSLPNEGRQSSVPLPALRSHGEILNGDARVSSAQQDHESLPPQGFESVHQHKVPVPSQIQKPLPHPTLSAVETTLPTSENEQVEVKAEITDDTIEIPHEMRPAAPEPRSPKDATLAGHNHPMEESAVSRVVASLKNDETYRPSPITTEAHNHSTSPTPKPAPTKKRAAPKKGTASAVKPAAKKRKIDTESIDGTPPMKRSATPASSRASKTPAPKNRKQESDTPTRSSSVAQPDDDDNASDSELFCICRKPDDHTWMIGCDGTCEDWFHGRCVNMTEDDGKIIDKWICPNCQAKGEGPTTWKAMCRLEGCRQPARVSGANPSKYCSEEHGREYMARHALKGESEEKRMAAVNSNKRRRKSNYTDNFGNGEEAIDADDDPSYLHGGVLRAPELKAVVAGVKDLKEFRKLGEGVLSPPRTVSPDGNDIKMEDRVQKAKVAYTDEETKKLAETTSAKESLRMRKSMLEDRDSFLSLVKTRGKTALDELRKKDKSLKDICGYDARLSWSDEEFKMWRCGPEGQKAFDDDVLGAPPPSEDANEMAEDDESLRGVCQKKRCERHRNWYKLQQQDVAFEKDEVRQGLRKLEGEERGVKDRAMIRCLESGEVEN